MQSGFAMQVDEYTNVTGLSGLLEFVRYLYKNQIKEEMLMSELLPIHITGEYIFGLIQCSTDFFSPATHRNLSKTL
jgi:hypothetical protein